MACGKTLRQGVADDVADKVDIHAADIFAEVVESSIGNAMGGIRLKAV
jgi:hypothetical protein